MGREGLLIGLSNGQVLQIFIDNPFPIPLVKVSSPIRCLDLSLSRIKLAVVDEDCNCFVYDLTTKELMFQEVNANSVAWNSELEDMLCYSGGGQLSIKAGNFPPYIQKLIGNVVGFRGSRIFSLHAQTMTAVDVPQSASLDRYMEKKDFPRAYQVACLGITEEEWRRLAMEALNALNFTIAKKAFLRIRDLSYVELIQGFEKLMDNGKNEKDLFEADIAAYGGKFTEVKDRNSSSYI